MVHLLHLPWHRVNIDLPQYEKKTYRLTWTYPRDTDLLKETLEILMMGWCHHYDDIIYQHEKNLIDAKILCYVLEEAFCRWTVWKVRKYILPKNWIRKNLWVIYTYLGSARSEQYHGITAYYFCQLKICIKNDKLRKILSEIPRFFTPNTVGDNEC